MVWLVARLLALLSVSFPISVEAVDLRALVLTGDPAPGYPTDEEPFPSFVAFGASGQVVPDPLVPVVNDDGHVLFYAGIPNAVWILDGDGLQLVTRGNDPAPGLPGETLLGVFNPLLADSGKLQLRAYFSDPGILEGIWIGDKSGFSLAVAENDLAPGTAGSRFFSLEPLTTVLVDG